mmetsp:Transcript_3475/g.11471  ORF Transcript_3475/g.11471 Transcript_3475/m.11471 type:complete len:348 (+) Transcript_3475:59-1102(+)
MSALLRGSLLAIAFAARAEGGPSHPQVQSLPNVTAGLRGRLVGPPNATTLEVGRNLTLRGPAASSIGLPHAVAPGIPRSPLTDPMISADDTLARWRAAFQTGVQVAAVGSNYLQHVSPFWSVLAIQKVGSVGELSPVPYITLLCNCAHWCSYGLLGWLFTGDSQKLLMTYGNVLGCVLGLYYTAVYWWSCDNRGLLQCMKRHLLFIAALVALECMLLELVPTALGLQVIGSVCTALSIAVAASPLSTVGTVVKMQSVESMPVHLALASLLAAVLWSLCGLLLSDLFLLGTNAVNVCASLLSLALIVRFHPKTRWMWDLRGPAAQSALGDSKFEEDPLRAPLNRPELP